jgi:hypothetical protein
LEHFWPVGEPAENIRNLMSGYSYKDEKDFKTAMKMLDGTFEPKEKKKNEVNMNHLITLFESKPK